MSRRRRSFITLAAASLALVLGAPRADAEPNVWQRALAGDSATGLSADYVHRTVQERVRESEMEGGPMGIHGGAALAALQGARDLLLRVGAASSLDLRLRFDLGQVLAAMHECAQAIPVLKSSLAAAPKHVRAANAWFELAICHALTSNHVDEEKAYLEALTLEDDPAALHSIYSNLAEARMGLGKMELAIEACERSIALYDSVLARWTFSVVKDRAGDPAGALAEAKIAVGRDPEFERLDSPSVFFEPPYDREWYHGLGELALSETASGVAEDKGQLSPRHKKLMRALVHFEKWLAAAPSDDRSRPFAESHVHALQKLMGLKAPK